MIDLIRLIEILQELESDDLGINETNDIESKETLASYYLPLFQREQRTEEFKLLFQECFGDNSFICHMPRPLLCPNCIKKYIKTTENLFIKTNTEIYNKLILPRLFELKENMEIIMEHNMASEEHLDQDTIYNMLNINMDVYDPPSTTVLDQCITSTYVKHEHDDESCAICLCEFEDNENVKKLICNHQFHDNCIMTWFKDHSTCPICKQSLK